MLNYKLNFNQKPPKILLALTGSIACYKTCTVISRLAQSGCEVEIIATSSALKFVGLATLEGLTGKKVHTELWQDGAHMAHIHLGRWADAFVIAPLTALHLNKMALGLSDDLLTSTYLAFEKTKPILFAPAMNHEMYTHETVQNNLAVLKNRLNHHVFETQHGVLACGDEGLGKMVEPETILTHIQNLFAASLHKDGSRAANDSDKKILITYGGTREPVDSVRCLTNTSTGTTGAALADQLAQLGYHIEVLKAESAVPAKNNLRTKTFTSHADLKDKLLQAVSHTYYHAVIHLAAVSDYTVGKILNAETPSIEIAPDENIKLSSGQHLQIELRPTDKIVNQIKAHSQNKNIQVIAFKLTNTLNASEQAQAVLKLLQSEGVDFVVHNDLNTISHDRSRHAFQIFGRGQQQWHAQHVNQLTEVISGLMS